MDWSWGDALTREDVRAELTRLWSKHNHTPLHLFLNKPEFDDISPDVKVQLYRFYEDRWRGKQTQERQRKKYIDYDLTPLDSIEVNSTGFKSPDKIAAIVKLKHPTANIEQLTRRVKASIDFPVNSFPVKENKAYHLHMAASRGTYLIDFMYSGKYIYLIAINVNTRKAYARPTNVQALNDLDDATAPNDALASDVETEFKERVTLNNRFTTRRFIETLTRMIDEDGMDVKHLRGDGQLAFASSTARQFYKSRGITFTPVVRLDVGITEPDGVPHHSEPMHTSLGIVDRFIRTLRDMAYNLNRSVIDSNFMQRLLYNYNNAPHKHLTKILGFSCSPNMVNYEMECELVRRIAQTNWEVMNSFGYRINNGTSVKVYNEKDNVRKRRTTIRPGKFKVTGWRNGMYEVTKDDGTKIQLPRFKIAPL